MAHVLILYLKDRKWQRLPRWTLLSNRCPILRNCFKFISASIRFIEVIQMFPVQIQATATAMVAKLLFIHYKELWQHACVLRYYSPSPSKALNGNVHFAADLEELDRGHLIQLVHIKEQQ
uniref:Uncharacterized protein n=1 Tax=Micrurus corallinus TaxID=54390 RepID=A0A2D4FCZ9_MICCO